jgi:ABC-type glycerol-3-phosphate transport system substrate-binding protein
MGCDPEDVSAGGVLEVVNRTRPRAAAALAFAVMLAGCTTGASPSASASPTSGPTASTAATEVPAPSGDVTALMLGWPDADGIDPASGKAVAGIGYLETTFEASHPGIDLTIINIPYGSGATGYGPKTEAMVQANEACVYRMPAGLDFARRGLIENLDDRIAADPTWENVWGPSLEFGRGWTPDNPSALVFLPSGADHRVIHWDAKLFDDWGVEPLSANPTLDEIHEKAIAMTGKNPVTGEDNFGYWYQGKYTVWQFLAIGHAFGGTWGGPNGDGTTTITWNNPQYLDALEWLVDMAKYAPAGSLAADAMPPGFLSDQNVVAIIPEGEPGYYLQAILNDEALRERFRVSHNLKGDDGLGGLRSSGGMTMAKSCENKEAAFEVLKWLAGSKEAQQYYFEQGGYLPTRADAPSVLPELEVLPDAEIIATESLTAEPFYNFPPETRSALQAALEAALAGTLTPKEALDQAQKETDDFLAQQP